MYFLYYVFYTEAAQSGACGPKLFSVLCFCKFLFAVLFFLGKMLLK